MNRRDVLPSLFTLGNLFCGFAAMAVIAHRAGDGASLWDREFVFAAWFILAAMVFDMFDGKVARLTGRTSDFGAQLDSLCDMVSFGVAPGIILYVLCYRYFGLPIILALLVSGFYAAAAAVRLARFNVHNDHAEDAHQFFQGLPSPAAAGVVASLVILNHYICDHQLQLRHHFMGLNGVRTSGTSLAMELLPFFALASAVLMVSSIPYVHISNVILKRKEPVQVVLLAVVFGAFMVFKPEVTPFCVFGGYLLSGPLASARRLFVGRAEIPEEEPGDEDEEDDREAMV
jgi:CDP-diacylglycerol--serine O-phosphatidyltransferase